jgi:hypothetical protein
MRRSDGNYAAIPYEVRNEEEVVSFVGSSEFPPPLQIAGANERSSPDLEDGYRPFFTTRRFRNFYGERSAFDPADFRSLSTRLP